MNIDYYEKRVKNLESSLDTLFTLESLLETLRESCLKKESESIYYNLPEKMMFKLSNERNRYISILTLALENVNDLKNSLE